ncbi:putative 45.2 kDa GTP-binding protein [Paratrimastix pyriformis]|uniref:45.2 kDa GTP-binding protein n=1 Tax=Paratrimastix pyriformis TaxID=342808 RepID=A0ABQ8UHV3_9EUKA|nr:putative 45.2 kDa GTP-binding protein [Paratrimastix pyriformis]
MEMFHHGPAGNILIGVVGKPSVGKSSFLNAATEAQAKVGSYPFTTITPNRAVGYYQLPCQCARFGLSHLCSPRYGSCENGIRRIPINLLDIAGLVPGASEGKVTYALISRPQSNFDRDVGMLFLMTCDMPKGDSTEGYDPSVDVAWFFDELHSWVCFFPPPSTRNLSFPQIFNNLWKKWPALVRKHLHAKTSPVQALLSQLSGYGARPVHIQRTLDALGSFELGTWDEGGVRRFVTTFLKTRFPIILVLNKIDTPRADQNMAKICAMYPDAQYVPVSAAAERFLRNLHKAGVIHYLEGSDHYVTAEDDREGRYSLKPLDERTRRRLLNIQDLMLFRYGSTGVQAAIQRAVETQRVLPVWLVKNVHNFTDGSGSPNPFRDVILVPEGSTVRDVAYSVSHDMGEGLQYAEGPDGRRMAEDEVITLQNNIFKFIWVPPVRAAPTGTGSPDGATATSTTPDAPHD